MKKLIVIAAALISTFLFSSCNKEQSVVGDTTITPELKTYTLTIEASIDPSTKQLGLTGNTLNAVWATGEEVMVMAGEPKQQIGTLYPTSAGSENTVLSGTVDITGLSKDSWIDLEFGGVGSGQDGTLAHAHDWAKAWFQIGSINTEEKTIVPKADSGTADKDGKVQFNNWTAIVRFIVKKGVDNLKVSKMVIKTTNGDPYGSDSKILTISPASATNELFVSLYNYDGDTPVTDDYEIIVTDEDGCSYSRKASSKTFKRGSFYSITLNVTPDTYTVVGEPLTVLPGDSTWDLDASANNLVFNSSTKLYSKVFTVPAATTYVTFKVVRNYDYDNGAWPASNYVIDDIKAGYVANLTINYNPATEEVSHNVEYTSPYRLYVKQDGLASSSLWGTTRSAWDTYDLIQLADVDSKKFLCLKRK